MKRILITLIGTLAIGILMAAFAGRAAAAPVLEPAPAAAVQPAEAILVTVDETGQPINACLAPGDTMASRAAIGAVVGALLGLPIYIVGAIPVALIGAGIGALSWHMADMQMRQLGMCG